MAWRKWLVLVAVAVLTGCASGTFNLPSISEDGASDRLAGKVVWHDLLSNQPNSTKDFYRELFGWEFDTLGIDFGFGVSGSYTLIRNNGRLIGGMVDMSRFPGGSDSDQWVVVMSTADIDLSVEQVRQSGGTVFTPPTDLAERGSIAVVADNQGAVFALLETGSGDPVDRNPEIGDFLWDELWTDDVMMAADFYSELAPYQRGSRATADGEIYKYLSTQSRPRVGIMNTPAEDLKPTWVSYIRVEDPAAIVVRVEALGGTVLMESRDRPAGGQVALIADPGGAGIALQTWTPPNGGAQ